MFGEQPYGQVRHRRDRRSGRGIDGQLLLVLRLQGVAVPGRPPGGRWRSSSAYPAPGPRQPPSATGPGHGLRRPQLLPRLLPADRVIARSIELAGRKDDGVRRNRRGTLMRGAKRLERGSSTSRTRASATDPSNPWLTALALQSMTVQLRVRPAGVPGAAPGRRLPGRTRSCPSGPGRWGCTGGCPRAERRPRRPLAVGGAGDEDPQPGHRRVPGRSRAGQRARLRSRRRRSARATGWRRRSAGGAGCWRWCG